MKFKDLNAGDKFICKTQLVEGSPNPTYMKTDFSRYIGEGAATLQKYFNCVNLLAGEIEWFHDDDDVYFVVH